MATKKRGSQTRLLPHDGNRKLRRTHRAQTRDTTLGGDIYDEDQSSVTSQSDMNVTPHRRGYMRSSLQRSCYVERYSEEGGATSPLNPLTLTYHFGRATSTPDRRRNSDITGHWLQPAVKHKVADRDGRDNFILDEIFGDGQRVHSMKLDGADRNMPEASATQSLGEVGGFYYKKKIETFPQWQKPWQFFSDKTKPLIGGHMKRKDTGRTIVYQNNAEPPVLRTVGGFYP